MTRIRLVVSGATGAVGRVLVPAIIAHDDFELVGAIGGRSVGQDVGVALGLGRPVGVEIAGDFASSLAGRSADVLLDYSTSEAAARNGLAALGAGVAVLLGTTAVDAGAVETMSRLAEAKGVGLFLAPNLTLVGQLMFRCADLLRPYFGDVEIVEFHNSAKRDAPSGTALETAHRLSSSRHPAETPDSTARGLQGARGAVAGDVHVHSVRVPAFYSRHEVLFGRPGQLLTVIADQFTTEPLIGPSLKAARLLLDVRGAVRDLPGLFDPD
jgi:4-hydroxy-tetrahydrodipicolinate reductase